MARTELKNRVDQRQLWHRAGQAGLLSLLLAAGCAGKRGQTAQGADQELTGTSLESLAQASATPNKQPAPAAAGQPEAPANSLEALVAQQTSDLERMMASANDPSAAPTAADPTAAWTSAPIDLNPSTVIATNSTATPEVAATPTPTPTDAAASGTSLESLAAAPLPGMPEAPATAMMEPSSTGLEALATPQANADGVIVNDAIPAKPMDEQVDAAATAFIDLLRQQASLSADPLRPYLMLSLLEAVRPGATPNVISPDGQTVPLSDAEQRTVNMLRDVVSGVVQPAPVNSGGSPAVLTQIVDKLAQDAPLSIRGIQLCTQVRGFGQFTSVPRNEFIQGTPHTVIVYAELDGLRARDARPSDGAMTGSDPTASGDTLAIELVQEINLYHDVDGLRVWGSPEARIVETSRSKRRDFYTIHTVTLPANLSVGVYKLKLVVRDATSGFVSDANIPVKIVAGSALSTAPGDDD